ncbi:hypothetical protein Hanom_Chr15g01414041 [Helianthus anomalus]
MKPFASTLFLQSHHRPCSSSPMVASFVAVCLLSIIGVIIFLALSNFLTSAVVLFADSTLTPRYCLHGVFFSTTDSPRFLFSLSFLLAEYSS